MSFAARHLQSYIQTCFDASIQAISTIIIGEGGIKLGIVHPSRSRAKY